MILRQNIRLQRSGTDSRHGPTFMTNDGVLINIEGAGAYIARLVEETLPYLGGGRSLTVSLTVDPALITLGQAPTKPGQAGGAEEGKNIS